MSILHYGDKYGCKKILRDLEKSTLLHNPFKLYSLKQVIRVIDADRGWPIFLAFSPAA